ncbi:chemotaxis protein CheC [bacterium]|nr:chemotaxis protein CheC [bacterium]
MIYTSDELDALTEMVNIGVGHAASSLSELLSERIDLSVPHISVCTINEIEQELARRTSDPLDTSIVQEFCGALSGRAILSFPRSSSLKLGQILCHMNDTPDQFDIDLSGVLNEVGNIVLNGVMGTISNIVMAQLEFGLTRLILDQRVTELVRDEARNYTASQHVLIADAKFRVQRRQIDGSLIIVFQVGSIQSIVQAAYAAHTQ